MLAFHIQKPDKKINHVLIVRGPQGSGKNLLFQNIMSMIVGPKNHRVVTGDALTSRFNNELTNTQVLVIDEVGLTDGHEAANRLKPMVTDETIRAEAKGQSRRVELTPRLMVLLSNYETPIPMDLGDRRYFVPDFGPVPQPSHFYSRIVAAFAAEVPAFYDALKKRDVKHFNPCASPPMTEDKAAIQAAVRDFTIPLPPLTEQAEIIAFVEAENSKLDALSDKANRVIDLLKERRTALISAAITGKIDVRPQAQIIQFPLEKCRMRGLVGVRIIEGLKGACGRTIVQKIAYLGEADTLQIPHLIRIAISHYQFETIHPFQDGNGRIGRLLIPLYLISNGLLAKPSLYLSDFFERNRGSYYDALTRVRMSNDMIHWVRFFLRGIAETAAKGRDVFQKILVLRTEVEQAVLGLGKRTPNARQALNLLYRQPIVSAGEIQTTLQISAPTANAIVADLMRLGIIVEITGQTRYRAYAFDRYLKLFVS